jgi:hypothetical protein
MLNGYAKGDAVKPRQRICHSRGISIIAPGADSALDANTNSCYVESVRLEPLLMMDRSFPLAVGK